MNKVEINKLVSDIHENNVKAGCWANLETGESLKSTQAESTEETFCSATFEYQYLKCKRIQNAKPKVKGI